METFQICFTVYLNVHYLLLLKLKQPASLFVYLDKRLVIMFNLFSLSAPHQKRLNGSPRHGNIVTIIQSNCCFLQLHSNWSGKYLCTDPKVLGQVGILITLNHSWDFSIIIFHLFFTSKLLNIVYYIYLCFACPLHLHDSANNCIDI